MSLTIEFTESALKQLRHLDKAQARRIVSFLNNRIVPCDDPRLLGKALVGNFSGLWRYRIGDFRVVAQIRDEKVVVVVVRVAHRKEVYECCTALN